MINCSMAKKIVICGNYGATNLGDEAILDGILKLVKLADSKNEVTVLAPDYRTAESVHKVKALPILPCGLKSFIKGLFGGTIWKTIDAIRKCDLFILGGGGLFTDEKLMAIIIWSMQAKFAQIFKKPVFCLGQSVGPLSTSFGKIKTAEVFKKSFKITVRDNMSADLLEGFGIDQVNVLADPAFCLDLELSAAASAEKYIVMSLREWQNVSPEQYAKFIIDVWKKYQLKTVLVPFQIATDNDLNILNKVYEEVKNDCNEPIVELFEYDLDYIKTVELIAKSTAVVGMRLHSLIFATICHKPFLALNYSTKVRGLIEDLGMGEYVLRLNEDAEKMMTYFEALMSNYEKIQNGLTEAHLRMRKRAEDHAQMI